MRAKHFAFSTVENAMKIRLIITIPPSPLSLSERYNLPTPNVSSTRNVAARRWNSKSASTRRKNIRRCTSPCYLVMLLVAPSSARTLCRVHLRGEGGGKVMRLSNRHCESRFIRPASRPLRIVPSFKL